MKGFYSANVPGVTQKLAQRIYFFCRFLFNFFLDLKKKWFLKIFVEIFWFFDHSSNLWNFLGFLWFFFWIFSGFFLLLFFWFLLILFKITKVTTKSYQGYYWTAKMAWNGSKQHNKLFFSPKGKISLGRRQKPSAGAGSRPA